MKSFPSDLTAQPGVRTTDLATSMSQVLDEVSVSCQRVHGPHTTLSSHPTILLLAYFTPVTLALNTQRALLPQGLRPNSLPVYTALSPRGLLPCQISCGMWSFSLTLFKLHAHHSLLIHSALFFLHNMYHHLFC